MLGRRKLQKLVETLLPGACLRVVGKTKEGIGISPVVLLGVSLTPVQFHNLLRVWSGSFCHIRCPASRNHAVLKGAGGQAKKPPWGEGDPEKKHVVF